MSDTSETITCFGLFETVLTDNANALALLASLAETDRSILPDRFGRSESGMRHAVGTELEQFLTEWDSTFIWKRGRPFVRGMVFSDEPYNWPHSVVAFECDKNITESTAWHALLSTWASLFSPTISLVHLLTPREVARGFQSNYLGHERNRAFNMLSTFTLKESLPELWWLTCFGNRYVDFIGRDLLMTTPAYRVQQCANGAIIIQLTESVEDVRDEARFNSIRERAVNHLGSDLFFDYAGLGTSRRVPNFTK